MVDRNSLTVIGCGRMASAIVTGMSAGGGHYDPLLLYDIDPLAAEGLAKISGGRVAATMKEAVAGADIILLAVKPQVIPLLLPDLTAQLQGGQLVVSVATGISTCYLERELGQHPAIIRAMPNTPCLVGKGTIALCEGNYTKTSDLAAAHQLFAPVGQVVMVTETQMDAVSALSGCGPAYFLLVAEAMIDAGVEMGLPRPLATQLVQSTLAGTGAMWEQSKEHPVILKEQVTSPGGSTIAALHVMEERGIRAAMMNAVARAVERTKEIGSGSGKGV